MSDFKQPNGKYLPEGIYMEATALSWTDGRAGTYHSYLVYRDGAGNAEVIRGGANPLGNGNMDLELEIGKSLSASSDAYTNKNIQYFDQQTHLYAKMDIGNRDAKTVWEEMKTNAGKIDTSIDYNIKIGNVAESVINFVTDKQLSLAKNSVVCHSVTGTVLKNSGIPIDTAIAKMDEADKSSKTITEDSFTGIKTDLFTDDVDKKVFYSDVVKVAKQISDFEKKAENTIDKLKDKVSDIEKKVEKAIDDTQNVIEAAKGIFQSLKGIQEGVQELKKSIPFLGHFVSDASDVKSSLSLEELVKNEVGVETLTLAAAQQPWERLNISQKDYESLANPDNDKQHVNDNINTHTATA
jgi:hypothetical protein